MKKKCLLIWKWPIYAQIFLVNKFSKFYDVEQVFINDFKNKVFSEIIDDINLLIEEKNIEIVFFDVDFNKLINFFFIKKIQNVKKILMTFDDFALHEMNAITANACDLVVTHCPLSVQKYKEKGYKVFFMPGEGDTDILKNYNLKKEIDVLFFGQINRVRKKFLDFVINNDISIKIVGEHWSGREMVKNDFVSEQELAKLISKSKIVLNLSKSTGDSVINYASEDIYKFYYQFKGRIIMAGLCGTLCVSEFSPGQEIMFNKDEVPTFYSKEECVEILKKLLADKDLLSKYTGSFCSKVLDLCEDKRNFKPIFNEIEKTNSKRVELIKFPYWYLRIAAKQALLRNIKLTKLIKSIFQFNEVFKIIENSNLLIKFLVIFESTINVFWYSLTATIKSKK